MKRVVVRSALVLLAAAVVLFNLSFWMSPHLQEEGDLAANALQIERAHRFEELLGPYSQHGFHHLGPVSFYYFAATEPLFGWVPTHLARHMLAQYALNLACVFGVTVLLRRSGLGPAAATAGGFLLLAQLVFLGGGAPIMTISTWGPVIAALPAAFYVVAAALLTQGHLVVLPWMAVAGTLVAHNHFSQGAVVFWVTVIVAAWVFIRRKRMSWTPEPPASRRVLAASALLLVPALLPVVLEQATGDPGNLALIARFLATQGPASHPWVEVLDKLGQALTDPWVIMFPRAAATIHTPVGIGILVLVLAAGSLMQLRRSEPAWRAVVVLLWLTVGITVVSARSVPGNLHTYLFYLLYPVCGLLYLAMFREIAFRLQACLPGKGFGFRSPFPVVLAAVAFFGPWLATHRIDPPAAQDRYLEIIDHFDLNPRDGIHLHLDRTGEEGIWDVLPTLALRFVRDGAAVSVPEDCLFICGQQMRATVTPHPLTLLITRRRPLEKDPRHLPGQRWGVFLLTPEDGSPADFLAALPAASP